MLPPLVAFLTANISQFQAKMAEAGAVATATTEGAAGKMAMLAGAGKVAFLGLAASVAIGGAVMMEMSKHIEEAGQAAFEMAEKTGMAGHQASAWIAAGQAVGVQAGQTSMAFVRMSRQIENINLALQAGHKPSAAMTQVFTDLGVKIYDSTGKLRSMNDMMLEVSDAFAKMPDGPEKTGIAMRLFGRSGADLIPLLNEGRKGITDFMAAAQKSGAVLSNDAVKGAHEAFLAHKQFDQAVTGLETQLSVGLLPIMTKVYGWLAGTGVPAIVSATQWMGHHQEIIKLVAIAIAGPLVLAIGAWTVSMTLAAIATIAATWPILVIIAAAALLALGIYELITHWKQISTFLTTEWRAATEFVGGTFSRLGSLVSGFFGGILRAGENAWREFSSRPVYWITRLVLAIPLELIKLNLQLVKWGEEMVVKGVLAFLRFREGAINEINQLPGQIWTWLLGVIQNVALWSIQMNEKAIQAAKDFGKWLLDELGKLPMQLTLMGASLVIAIINGIGSQAQAAKDAIKNVIQGAIDQAKATFGIKSPSTVVMAQIGTPLGQAIPAGILGQTSAAAQAMKSLVSSSLGAGSGQAVLGLGFTGTTLVSSSPQATPYSASGAPSSSVLADPQLLALLRSIDRTLTQILSAPSSVSPATLLRRLG